MATRPPRGPPSSTTAPHWSTAGTAAASGPSAAARRPRPRSLSGSGAGEGREALRDRLLKLALDLLEGLEVLLGLVLVVVGDVVADVLERVGHLAVAVGDRRVDRLQLGRRVDVGDIVGNVADRRDRVVDR